MNTEIRSGPLLERELAAKLRELLGQVHWLTGWDVEVNDPGADFDLLARLPLKGGGKAALCVECKRELRPSQFSQLIGRTFSLAGNFKVVVPVLALPWISPRLEQLCLENGWSWFDLAGNHRLDVPDFLLLLRSGNPPVHGRPRVAANLSTREAGRVIRALLVPDNAGIAWTQREILNHSQPEVSLGLVNKVVQHLRSEAFLEEFERGFGLRKPLPLLNAWRDAYRFDRHEQRGYFTLLQGRKLHEALNRFGLDAELAAYASFSAAEFQAPHVRQPKTWLYVRRQDLPEFEELLGARPVDSGENIIVLIPDDEGVHYMADGGLLGETRLAATNVVQTYVDLYHSGGRGREAAAALLDQRLRPLWKAKGLKV